MQTDRTLAKVAMVDLARLHSDLAAEIEDAVRRVLRCGRYILGDEVETFEEAFAAYVGTRHCIGVANGTEALALALRAMGVSPGDEVVVPSNTCSPTWLAVASLGALPVPVDPDPATFTLDPAKLEGALSPKTRAIVPVHLYGHPCDMDPVLDIARSHGIYVLEDAAQAHGACYRSTRTGAIGDAAAWSFYPTKNLGAIGDGGAVTTNNHGFAAEVRSLRNYGWQDDRPYQSHTAGMNSRLDELQAAILALKLPYLDRWNMRRSDIARAYSTGVDNPSVTLPAAAPWATHAWHLYVVRCRSRDALKDHLARSHIESIVHYPTPPGRQPAFWRAEHPPATPGVADRLSSEVLSLPIAPHLSDGEVQHVVETLSSFDPGEGLR